MKNYERPIVMINEDLAEGVYASGSGAAPAGYDNADCWVIIHNGETANDVPSESAREFQFNADHASIEVGHAPDSVWVVNFSQDITNVVSCSGMHTEISGSTVYVYRKWDNKNILEQWGFALKVQCANYKTVTVSSAYIACNVQ